MNVTDWKKKPFGNEKEREHNKKRITTMEEEGKPTSCLSVQQHS